MTRHRTYSTWRQHLLHLCGVVVLSGIVGCGPSRSAANSSTITVWHWMTDREEAFAELAKRYQAEHQVPVHFELYAPSDVYSQKVRSAAQTDGLPDIYGILGELRDVASFIHAGHVQPLDEAMAKDGWKELFFPKALATNAFQADNSYGLPPGIYAVPIDVTSIQIFYNKTLLDSIGWDPAKPPQTWKAFLEVGKRAKAKNISGLVSGWAELWMIDCFATNYAIHTMGQKKVEATYRGQVRYTDPAWITVLNLFAQLRDSGVLADGIVTMGNKRAEQLFANGQAIFAFNGTWGVNVYRSMNPMMDYGVMMPPRVTDQPMVTWGGAGSSFFVNAKSPRRDAAVAFLRWMTSEPQQQYLMEATQNIPANRQAAANLPKQLGEFADDMDATIHPRLLSVQEQSPVIEAFDKGIQSIIIGESTPEQVAKQVDAVKQREDHHEATRTPPSHAGG